MARELAKIVSIQKIFGIEGYDRIEGAIVDNYEAIIPKGEYKEGDLAIYIGEETTVPVKPCFEFLRKRCYVKRMDRFRIRPMKMAGMISMGLVMPISILPGSKDAKEGMDVTEILGVERYEPELKSFESEGKKKGFLYKKLMRYRWFRLMVAEKQTTKFPKNVEKTDEDNIQRVYNKMKEKYPNTLFMLTEKVEGMSATFSIEGKLFKKYRVFSHNIEKKDDGHNVWSTVGKKLNLEKKLKKLGRNIAIQGEIVGPGIQKNIYNLDEYKLYVFKIIDIDLGYIYDFVEMMLICGELHLSVVPYMELKAINKFDTLEDMVKYSDGKSRINPNANREGIVWCAYHKDDCPHFKVKSKEYAYWFDNFKGSE